MQVQPYLQFDGRCEEALEFYKSALGAEVEALMRFKEGPDCMEMPQGTGDKVLHSCFRIGDSRIMASDGCTATPGFSGFSLSVACAMETEAKRAFSAMSDGGQVIMPLGKTFWSPCFGMLTDRFGIGWMITVVEPEQK